MRSMTIGRFLAVMVTAFAIAMSGEVFGLAYLMYHDAEVARQAAAANNRQTEALFALLGFVSKVQSTEQQLVREKDPDKIESLIQQGQVFAKDAKDALERMR